jgi:hypothetical protein
MVPPQTLTFEEIARRLDHAGVAWAVFAGAAASVYGATHPLTDIDIVVPSREGERVVSLFPEAAVERDADGTLVGLELPGFDILAGLTWNTPDLVLNVDLDTQMAARLARHEIAGVLVPVIPPEDNILLKALLGRGPEQGKHDWADVEGMLAHVPGLDWDYVRWRASACGPPEWVRRTLQRLETISKELGKEVPTADGR